MKPKPQNTAAPAAAKAGFSMVELAVVLVIFGGIAAMSVTLGGAWIAKERVQTTKRTQDTISLALKTYIKTNGRLPCPATITLTPSDTGYGLEAYETGDTLGKCHTEAGLNASDATGGVSFGAVPARTLGLPDSAMRDQWDNVMVYYITDDATKDGGFWKWPAGANYINPLNDAAGKVQILDARGTARTTAAIYALVSHGENGHGGYRKSGSRVSDSDATASELENCDCDASAAATTSDNVLVIDSIGTQSDDIVSFKLRSQIEN